MHILPIEQFETLLDAMCAYKDKFGCKSTNVAFAGLIELGMQEVRARQLLEREVFKKGVNPEAAPTSAA